MPLLKIAPARTRYTYPPSPDSDQGDVSPSKTPAQRLRALQAELAALEAEVAASPEQAEESEEENAQDLLRGLVNVRERIEQVHLARKGRGAILVKTVDEEPPLAEKDDQAEIKGEHETGESSKEVQPGGVRDLADIDRRVGTLEELVGSASAALDEVRFGVSLHLSSLNCIIYVDLSAAATAVAHAQSIERSACLAHTASAYRCCFSSFEAPPH
jgi:hypothetical protein